VGGPVIPAILLDTHVLVWALTEPDKLSARAHDLLADARVDLWVSAVSAFEIATKYRLGKLPGAETVLNDFERHLDRLGAQRLAISVPHAARAGGLDWDHRDPFDRLLAAQAELESLPLMTADTVFEQRSAVTVITA
jgi:PIN domain nuclease of toxin-antitoxin system